MGRIILFIFLLLTGTSAFAMNAEQQEAGQWVKDWWQSDINIQIKESLDADQKATCEKKIDHYSQKVEERPDSVYFKTKLKSWLMRCVK